MKLHKKDARGGVRKGAGRHALPQDEKFARTSITFPQEAHAYTVQCVDRGRAASVSGFITQLVYADMNGRLPPADIISEGALENLVQFATPALSRQLKTVLEGRDIDQSAFLSHVVSAAVSYLKAGGGDDGPFILTRP